MKLILNILVGLFILIVSIAILSIILLEESSSKINYEIQQKIGGTLFVEGEFWMDFQSFGDITTIYYIPKDNINDKFKIGDSDYYGREFDKDKQIIKKDDEYVLSVGNGLDGDMILASKNLKNWEEFVFSRPSIQVCLEKKLKVKDLYLTNYSPDEIFLKKSIDYANWIRRVGKGEDLKAQKITFSFYLDWQKKLISCNKIIKIEENIDF